MAKDFVGWHSTLTKFFYYKIVIQYLDSFFFIKLDCFDIRGVV